MKMFFFLRGVCGIPCPPLFSRPLLAKFLKAGQIRVVQLRAGLIRAKKFYTTYCNVFLLSSFQVRAIEWNYLKNIVVID